MTLEEEIAALIALGPDGLRRALISPSVAQECARRWLMDEATRRERARVRDAEVAASMQRTLPDRSDERRAFYRWVQELPPENLPWFSEGIETTRPIDWWSEGFGYSGNVPAEWRSGEFEKLLERARRFAREKRERTNHARRKGWAKTLDRVDEIIEERAANMQHVSRCWRSTPPPRSTRQLATGRRSTPSTQRERDA